LLVKYINTLPSTTTTTTSSSSDHNSCDADGYDMNRFDQLFMDAISFITYHDVVLMKDKPRIYDNNDIIDNNILLSIISLLS